MGDVDLVGLIELAVRNRVTVISAQTETGLLWLQTVCDKHILGQTPAHRLTDRWTFTSAEH